jgi:hypothetical protein
MADEAFALSPISARATLPGEADYDAISAAFMETSRGRWFLSEYAKRNRNADTRMVLDAVARIEQNLAAEKNAAPDNGSVEALAVIMDAVAEARVAASAVLDGLGIEASLAPIRNGARVIRETLLKLREIGADGRIYDLMDSQVGAIEGGCGRLAAADAHAALTAAFDLIEARTKRFAGDDTERPSQVSEAAQPPSQTAYEETPAAVPEATPPSGTAPETAAVAAVSPPEDIAATAEIDNAAPDTETALDDALDMIALEMAAPDLADDNADEFFITEPDMAEPAIVARVEPIVAPKPAPTPEFSLGASLIANGIVRRPDTSVADPLAPIRRMSQAEKIAFFS